MQNNPCETALPAQFQTVFYAMYDKLRENKNMELKQMFS